MNDNSTVCNRPQLTGLLKRFGYCLLLIFCIKFAATAWAGERATLGNTTSMPLAASIDPGVRQTLSLLRQSSATDGTVRIIVGVRAAFAPEGELSSTAAEFQRREISEMHSAVLDKVRSLKRKPETTKRFTGLPFMALEVTSAELEALAGLTEITSIVEDRKSAPHLAQSVPLIGGVTAWANGYSGAGQTVAVLDTGVDKTHPFLAGKVISEACYSTNSITKGASTLCPGGATASTAPGSAMPYTSGVCPAGECDHGTHVAGIAAGNGASLLGVGYSGVAKDASVVAIQVASRFTPSACGSTSACVMSYDSDQILGLQRIYELRNSYHIAAVNISLGGGSYSSQGLCDSDNLSMKAAIDNLRAVNIATVVSSGNDGYASRMSAPACISSAISVGATWDVAGVNNSCAGNNLGTTKVNDVACYSNAAPFLNLLAPGSLITSSIPSNGYAQWNGTSMAAPHVTGAWALLKQKNSAEIVATALSKLSATGLPVTDPRNGNVKPRIRIDAALSASPPSARLINLSSRGQVQTGNDVMIGGFIISGFAPKTVVVRASGPSLAASGINNFLANPKLQLFSGPNQIAFNDNWQSADNQATLAASGFAPGNPLEAAIYTTLAPGAYTAIVTGIGDTAGVGIVEVFEIDHPEIPLINISTRGQVLTGNDVMIGGFIIQGTNPQTVVVRALGPSLAAAGITTPLANPMLQLFSGSTQIAVNDNWQSDPQAAALQASGFAPSDPKEAAMLITLNPGAYTAVITGVGSTTGVAIFEVFAK